MTESVSRLLDHDTPPEQRGEVLDQIIASERLQKHWSNYHVIGSVIRGEVVVAGVDRGNRIQRTLALEPTVLVPLSDAQRPDDAVRQRKKMPLGGWQSAGMLALAASVALMAVVLNPVQDSTSAGRVAAEVRPLPASQAERDRFNREISEMLTSHGEFSAASGLNGLVTYAKLIGVE